MLTVMDFMISIFVFCINTGSSAAGPQCSRSLNGGLTWMFKDLDTRLTPLNVPDYMAT